MNVHEQVIKGMHEMAEKFSKAGVVLKMTPPSNATLGTRYTEIDAGKMLAQDLCHCESGSGFADQKPSCP